ncbi:MAG TPA: hypothetical protein VN361_09965 [Oxalicibacterium sp.]|nr:hypothetical protein [Oxalicibacterium sp.]
MKRYYAIACAVSAACAAFLALHSLPAAAESRPAMQPHISELVTMAVPPYKW